MPRKPRIEFEGAFYHVITRGNQRQKIFKSLADYQKYLQLLTIYKNRYHCSIYAYILMGNHVHILIETKDTPLSKVFQGINQSYTVYFNKKYHTVGHLFQGRYKAVLCDRENYLLALLKYIHYNPVRAKIAETLADHPWSSHHAYTGKSNLLGLVDTEQVLRLFSERKGRARKLYRAFIEEAGGLKKDEVYATIDQRVQGSDEFAEEVLRKYEKTPVKPWRKAYTLDRIAEGVTELYGISPQLLRSSGRTRPLSSGRCLFSLAAKDQGYKGVEIAVYLEKEPPSISAYDRKRDLFTGDLTALQGHLTRGNKN
ncbi:MAG TPA: transposase [Nitrospirota bacterium]|nr:transposase [Nitrospirota bacterium]